MRNNARRAKMTEGNAEPSFHVPLFAIADHQIRVEWRFAPDGVTMPYTPELVHELNALIRFDLDTGQQGIKVHKSADTEVISAVQRLHAKGLVTQADGGYLTSLGREAAENAQVVLGLLTAGVAASVQ
jgi:uncharacterized protein (TIGR02647 family)